MDFHHQLKGAILDAVDEGLVERDPTRKAIIKGKTPAVKKIKYLNQFELHTLISSLDLKSEVNWDWFILLVAKTGMRFSEALALTPSDFDFAHQMLSISKTWDHKGDGGFLPTKNKSSVRKIQIDWQTVIQFSELLKGLPEDKPIFVTGKVYNSTVNDILGRYCKAANINVTDIIFRHIKRSYGICSLRRKFFITVIISAYLTNEIPVFIEGENKCQIGKICVIIYNCRRNIKLAVGIKHHLTKLCYPVIAKIL